MASSEKDVDAMLILELILFSYLEVIAGVGKYCCVLLKLPRCVFWNRKKILVWKKGELFLVFLDKFN